MSFNFLGKEQNNEKGTKHYVFLFSSIKSQTLITIENGTKVYEFGDEVRKIFGHRDEDF